VDFLIFFGLKFRLKLLPLIGPQIKLVEGAVIFEHVLLPTKKNQIRSKRANRVISQRWGILLLWTSNLHFVPR